MHAHVCVGGGGDEAVCHKGKGHLTNNKPVESIIVPGSEPQTTVGRVFGTKGRGL